MPPTDAPRLRVILWVFVDDLPITLGIGATKWNRASGKYRSHVHFLSSHCLTADVAGLLRRFIQYAARQPPCDYVSLTIR